jgi:ABC-type nickel/cobalt efflux system permease component RcnA
VKRVALLVGLLAALLAPAVASAHPLGNFTINRFSHVEASGDRIYVRYVLDMAEIPTFQARPAIEREGEQRYATRLAATLAKGMRVTVDGKPLPLRPLRHELAFPPGQAGLHTLRLEAVYTAPALPHGRELHVDYRDTNYASRIGWKEIVVADSAGARVDSTTAARTTISEELRSYPKNLLQSPLDVTSARAVVTPGDGPGIVPALESRQDLESRVGVRAVGDNGFAKLIVHEKLSVGFVLLSLLIAAFWGGAHAFSPGHGKSVITAYLVGSRGTPRHAVLLGLTTTVTHTIGVFGLGLVTLALSEFIVPEQLYPWLNLTAALLVLAVGVSVLRWRVREWRRRGAASHPHHRDHGDGYRHRHSHHYHQHPHDHEGSRHAHSHAEPGLSLKTLLGVGISGGIIPCPTALVVLLAAISLHRIAYGLVLIVAFSAGLAVSITGIGILAVSAKRIFNRVDFDGRAVRLLPAVSAVVIVALGIAMTVRAVPHLG